MPVFKRILPGTVKIKILQKLVYLVEGFGAYVTAKLMRSLADSVYQSMYRYINPVVFEFLALLVLGAVIWSLHRYFYNSIRNKIIG